MQFRPCIDIHDGCVKQIVGGSLRDNSSGGETVSKAKENFIAKQDAAFYARMYKESGIFGGHVILLNPTGTPEYEADKKQAFGALAEFPNGLQVGGGIHADNAEEFLDAGASHVIITSYVFTDGRIRYDRLEDLRSRIGKEHLVLDLSCRKKDGVYYVVTDRWQVFTNEIVDLSLLNGLREYCDEFLIHAVDAEGKRQGVEEEIVKLLGAFDGVSTYAGGIGSFKDLKTIRELGNNHVHATIGSALSIFGGDMDYETVLTYIEKGVTE